MRVCECVHVWSHTSPERARYVQSMLVYTEEDIGLLQHSAMNTAVDKYVWINTLKTYCMTAFFSFRVKNVM